MRSKHNIDNNPLNQKLIDEEADTHNPLHQEEGSSQGGYTPPGSPRSIAVDLEEVDVGFVLTKETAESISVLEPKTGVPMSLFDLFLHEIGRELNRRQEKGPYKIEARELTLLHKKLQEAGPEIDIKYTVRNFLNQRDLSASFLSEESFWDTIRYSLNQTLRFQPPLGKPKDMFENSSPKPSFWTKLTVSRSTSDEIIEPGTIRDKQNATPRDIKEDDHASVEKRIQWFITKDKATKLRQQDDSTIENTLSDNESTDNESTDSTLTKR